MVVIIYAILNLFGFVTTHSFQIAQFVHNAEMDFELEEGNYAMKETQYLIPWMILRALIKDAIRIALVIGRVGIVKTEAKMIQMNVIRYAMMG